MGLKVNKDTQATAMKQFRINPEVNNGLCKGYLESVNVTEMNEVANDSGWKKFIGCKPYRLNFVFKEFTSDANDEAGTYIHSFNPIDYTTAKSPEKLEDSISKYIGHFIEVFTGKKLADLDIDLELLVNGKEINSQNADDFTGHQIIDGFKKFFEDVAEVFNGKGEKPCIYKTADGNNIPLWIKLLLYNGTAIVNNGNPGMPMYPNAGVIEKVDGNKKPNLQIFVAKGESIIPKAKPTRSIANDAPPAPGDEIDRPNFLR